MLLTTAITIGTLAAYSIYMTNDKSNKICNASELLDIKGDGIKCSKSVQLSTKQSNEHILMIAPSGTGKSRRFIMPNVNKLENCSIIVTDPSGEIEKTCIVNKNKYILNPFSNNSIGYDPLRNCKSEFEVRKLAKILLLNGSSNINNINSNRQDWIEMSTPLLASYMLYNYHTNKYSFSKLVENISTMPILPLKNKDTKSIYDEIMESNVISAITELKMFLQVMGAPQTLSSIRIVLNSCLQLFLDENVKSIFEKPNIDLSKIRKEESIIYIQIPERHAEYFAPLTATFVTQVLDIILDKNGLQTYLLFDEFSNIGVIPDMCKLLSTARKRDVSVVAAIQSLTQLFRVYGEIQGKELQELFKCILVSSGLKDSAEYIANLLGTRVEVRNNTRQSNPLMTSDELRRMKSDEVLIICNNKRPVKDKMIQMVV